MGGNVNYVSRSQCPEERRAENHKHNNRKTWASKAWREARDRFLIANPICQFCRSESRVPHHPDIEVYGHPEYLNLAGTVALCRTCHRGLHTGRFPCSNCKKINSKQEGNLCYACLPRSDRERAIFRREHRQRERNKIESDKSKSAYRWKKERGIK